jgi:hypothetical protein
VISVILKIELQILQIFASHRLASACKHIINITFKSPLNGQRYAASSTINIISKPISHLILFSKIFETMDHVHLSLSSIIILSFLTILPPSDCVGDEQPFVMCNRPYNCGSLININPYPFWGDSWPEYCGQHGHFFPLFSLYVCCFQLISDELIMRTTNLLSFYQVNHPYILSKHVLIALRVSKVHLQVAIKSILMPFLWSILIG